MEKTLKILMISSDRKVYDEGSAVLERMKEYGAMVEELHIVLLSDSSHGLKDKQIDKNVWVYPTNSSIKFLRPLDASRIGKKIVFEKKFVRGQSVITTQDPFECGWAGLRVKKKWRIALEVQLHTDPFSKYFNGFKNTVRKLFVGGVLRSADSIRVVSVDLKSRISKFSPSEIRVLPIYVDQKKIEDSRIVFDLRARYPWHFIMLAVSRLAPEKNIDLALMVLALVRKKFPGTGFVIVGSGPEEGRLKAIVRKLKLGGAVEFVGWQENLASFYKTANVFIQTSLFEGYGLSLIEAGLSGLPVITTPVGVAKELEHGKDAYIFSPEAEVFAGGVMDLIENNHKRESLRINMRHTLSTKLISKDDYMAQIKDGWEKTAGKVRINE